MSMIITVAKLFSLLNAVTGPVTLADGDSSNLREAPSEQITS